MCPHRNESQLASLMHKTLKESLKTRTALQTVSDLQSPRLINTLYIASVVRNSNVYRANRIYIIPIELDIPCVAY